LAPADRASRLRPKPVDPSKIELPEQFKSWVLEKYPKASETAMAWGNWSEVPDYLRAEWWREEKQKLPVKI
jgi:hypothetical protein